MFRRAAAVLYDASVASVLVAAGALKFLGYGPHSSLSAVGMSFHLAGGLGVVLALTEIAVGGSTLIWRGSRWVGGAVTVLLVGFEFVHVVAVIEGKTHSSCGCLGVARGPSHGVMLVAVAVALALTSMRFRCVVAPGPVGVS